MKIAVGTKNPAKLNAVKIAFDLMYPNNENQVIGLNVTSGVSDQPMDPTESIKGARNRAQNALHECISADYGVGLEGGLEKVEDDWFDCGWCVIVDRGGREGVASSARIPTPKIIMDQIFKGKELGEVIDIIFKTTNAKQAEGHFGLMTNNVITRTQGYVHGICMAFSRFLHPEIFE